MRILLLFSIITLMAISAGCMKNQPPSPNPSALEAKIRRFAPTTLSGDNTRLSEGDQQALLKLIQAAKIMDRLYLRQSWSGNEALLERLSKESSPEGQERYSYFLINMGPWSALDHNAPFIEGVPPRPPQANFYPENLTKAEFEAWLATLPEAEQKQATGFFHTIRRDPQGRLKAVPYNEEYRDQLEPAAALLRDAAKLTSNPTLKEYLSKRADSFLSNDYYESDVAWMKLDSPIDVTIGPYEVYRDELFNYKAAFEAFITLRNDAETAKLSLFSAQLQEIENHLPIDPRYRNAKLGALAPISVVDEVAIGGEARAGVQTAAFNLPNDERVTATYGSKRVMLKNVQEAKFQKILVPIAKIALDPAQQQEIAFEPFFTHILAHELMHGLGPHNITVNNQQTTVRQAMRNLSSALEEAKADISGLFALQFLIDKGMLPATMERPMYTTFLAGVFRSVRFGINEAHGKGMALQFNYLLDEGSFTYNQAQGIFGVDYAKIKSAVRKLTGEIMTIQAEGSYDKAKALLERYAVIRPPMRQVLDKLAALPVDIAPIFPLAP
jgi:Peptidase family M49